MIELKGITWDHSRGYDPLVAASKLFAKKNDIHVSWQKRTLKDFGDQSLADLANNFDLLIIDHPHSGVAAQQKCVLSLDKFMAAADFKLLRDQSGGPSFDSYHYARHQWALPIDAAMQCAAFREDLMEGERPPQTWKEAFQVKLMGMALCPTDCLCTFLTLAAQHKTPIREGNKILLDEDKGVQVIDLMKLIKTKSHPESMHWNPIELFDNMTENDEVAYAPLAFSYSNYSREGYRRKTLTFTNPPGGRGSVLGGAGIAVSTKCTQQDNAVRYANWLCSEKTQKDVYVKAQGQPANIKAWEDKKANLITNHFFENTLASLKNAYVRPRFCQWPKFQEYLGNVVHECLNQNTDSLKVIQHLNQTFEKVQRNS